jgi:hypothetical protein
MAFADGLTPERRAALSARAIEVVQKRDAAEVLLARDLRAEALHLGLEMAGIVEECIVALADSPELQSRGARRASDDLRWSIVQLANPPAIDRQVTWAQVRALRTLLSAELRLRPRIRESLFDRPALARLRVQRLLAAAAVLLSPLAIAMFVSRSFYAPTARASAVLDDQYTADRVLDGDPDTEWVASGSDEWLELRFHKQTIHGLRILNGDTLPDRAVKEMHVDFYNGNESHATHPRTFERQHPAERQDYDVGGIICDRIRIVVTAHYGAGAAIAEVEVW